MEDERKNIKLNKKIYVIYKWVAKIKDPNLKAPARAEPKKDPQKKGRCLGPDLRTIAGVAITNLVVKVYPNFIGVFSQI